MDKRGISPLIATVLIIGLTVAVVSTIMIWGKGVYEERKEKEGAISGVEFDCSTGVGYDVMSAEFDDDIVYVGIENIGDKDIDGFRFRILGSNDLYSPGEIREVVSVLQFKTLSLNYDWNEVGNAVELELFPMFKVGKDAYVTCNEQTTTVNIVPK